VEGYRYWNVKQPGVYIRRLNTLPTVGCFPWSTALAHKHKLSKKESMSDIIITQLRLLQEGLDLDEFTAKFDRELTDVYPGIVEQLIEWDLIELQQRRLLLTKRGRLLSNQVFYRFM
jgi:oxygen-independent coproporphyrinogen-3 oxidase